MAKVYAFPMKKKLPSGAEERIKQIAKEYVEAIYAAATLMNLTGDPPTTDEMQEMFGAAFAEGIIEAIDELEKTPSS